MNFSGKRKRRAPTVIIIALIDVLMVVLIFMMVTTTFKQQLPSVKLALPESRQARSGASEDPPLIITVSEKEPHLFIGNRAVTAERLQQELQAAARVNPAVKLAIRADKKAPFEQILLVMDAAKGANIKGVNAMVKRGEGK